jgi:hypothetical protein
MSLQLQQVLIDIDRLFSAEQLQIIEHITAKHEEVKTQLGMLGSLHPSQDTKTSP